MERRENPTPSLTVLLVDDEPNIRQVLGISLEAEGHHVTAVINLKDALSEAMRRPFDLAKVRTACSQRMRLALPLLPA